MIWIAATALLLQDVSFERTMVADASEPARRARSAQMAFERNRRRFLPRDFGGSRGACDTRIGRFCYWYDDSDTTLPADPEPVRVARLRLIATLDSAGRDRPDSDWIHGQRVRYLLEQEATDSALEAAADCRGTAWWCAAVAGLAHHVARRYPEADSLFTTALDAMPDSIRCAWTDWEIAFEIEPERDDDPDCGRRAAFADTLIWLGRPLLSSAGNDLRTELFSRRVMAVLHATARSPHQIGWGRDMEELLLRYGWTTRYSVTSSTYSIEEPSVVGHSRYPSYGFLPVGRGDPGEAPWRWELESELPRSRYAPAYADHFEETTEFQIARFPRGDSTVFVGILSPPAKDTAFRNAVGIGFAVTDGPRRVAAVRADSLAAVRALVVTGPSGPVIASVEAWALGAKRFVRARTALPGPDSALAFRLSDPLLFEAQAELPASLDEAAARALPAGRISRSEPVGVYWETSGIGGDSMTVSISVLPVRRGLLGRIAQGLTVVGAKAPLAIEWKTEGAPDFAGQAIELDLGRLDNGRYLLRLEAKTERGIVSSERSIELIP